MMVSYGFRSHGAHGVPLRHPFDVRIFPLKKPSIIWGTPPHLWKAPSRIIPLKKHKMSSARCFWVPHWMGQTKGLMNGISPSWDELGTIYNVYIYREREMDFTSLASKVSAALTWKIDPSNNLCLEQGFAIPNHRSSGGIFNLHHPRRETCDMCG